MIKAETTMDHPSQPDGTNAPDAILFAFMRREIRTGLLFVELAAGAHDDPARRARYRVSAEQVRDSVLKLMAQGPLTRDDEEQIETELATLQRAIATLSK